MAGVIEGGLNVRARQFREAAQQGIPGLAIGQLLQNDGDGNAGAFDNRLAAANPRIDFNSVAHGRKLPRCLSPGKWLSATVGAALVARKSTTKESITKAVTTVKSFVSKLFGGKKKK